MDPLESYRNIIGEKLTRRCAQALKDNEITQEELAQISDYILENIDKPQDASSLVQFLDNLSLKWAIFSNLATIEDAKEKQGDDEQKAQNVKEMLQEEVSNGGSVNA